MLFGKLFTNPKMWVNGDADEITMGGVYTCKDVQNVPTGDGALLVFKTENTVKQVFVPVDEDGVVYTRVLGEEWASVTGTSEETEALIQSAIDKANQAQAKADTVDTRLNNIILESGTSDAEVVAARTDSEGHTFATLGQRLDTQFSEAMGRNYIPSTLLMNAVEAIGNSEYLKTNLVDGVLFNVFGTFEARIKVWGQYGTSAFVQITEIYNADKPLEAPTSFITKPGRYFVRNINRFDNMQVRIDQYTSGQVSVRASSAESEDIFDVYSVRKKHILITSMLGVTVNAGTTNTLNVVDVSPYAFVYCAARASEYHNFDVTVHYQHNGNTLGSTVPVTTMISGNVHRAASEWIEVKGTIAAFAVSNKSDSAKTYDVFFYGVR